MSLTPIIIIDNDSIAHAARDYVKAVDAYNDADNNLFRWQNLSRHHQRPDNYDIMLKTFKEIRNQADRNRRLAYDKLSAIVSGNIP